MTTEIIVNTEGEGEGSAPAQSALPEPSISVEALRLIKESEALRASLELFRTEITALSNRLDAHERANEAEFLEIRELIDGLEYVAETAGETASAAAAVAAEALAENPTPEVVDESGDLGGEVPANVAEAEANEPAPPSEEYIERRHKRAFVSL